VTLFDTAQAYGFGESERLLARALAGRARDKVIIATKGGLRQTDSGMVRDASPEWIREGVDASLRALGTDYIDLFQLHWPDPNTPFDETADALAKLVANGKVRHVGVSNFDAEQMEAFGVTLPVETLQPPYHLFRRDIKTTVLPYTQAHDIGVLVYGPLAHGLLSGHFGPDPKFEPGDWRATSPVFHGEPYRRNLEVVAALTRLAHDELGVSVSRLAVAWTLANPAVQVAIVGTRNPDHIDDAMAAAYLDLGPDLLDRINAIMADAVPVGGPSPEMVR
jgi:aryl-alcohol dehydrogenase-like predicted oxidoreductase